MKPSLLQLHRRARGWTQFFVAEHLGTSEQSIGRWERGEAFPQETYRQRLCALFEATPEALGLDRQGPSPSQESVEAPFTDPLLPSPPRIIGREKERHQLRRWLGASDCPPIISLYGLPGIGKTSLVLSLIQSADLHLQFDGILWASLGLHSALREHLQHWGRVLGETELRSDEIAPLVQTIRARIGTRKMLLLLDDLWRLEDLATLRMVAPHGVCLVTTRSPVIAASAERMVRVRELREEESIALLKRLAPRLSSRSLEIRSLVAAVGGLPLALTLIGLYLRRQTYGGSQRRFQEALVALQNVNHRLFLQEPGDLSSATLQGALSLQASIEASMLALSDASRRALVALSTLDTPSQTFSEEEARQAMREGTLADLDALCDAGLLEQMGSRYHLHPVIADYARCRLAQTSA